MTPAPKKNAAIHVRLRDWIAFRRRYASPNLNVWTTAVAVSLRRSSIATCAPRFGSVSRSEKNRNRNVGTARMRNAGRHSSIRDDTKIAAMMPATGPPMLPTMFANRWTANTFGSDAGG